MSDDPDLYMSKISFILKSDNVEDLDLTFEEEIYDKNKVFVKVLPKFLSVLNFICTKIIKLMSKFDYTFSETKLFLFNQGKSI